MHGSNSAKYSGGDCRSNPCQVCVPLALLTLEISVGCTYLHFSLSCHPDLARGAPATTCVADDSTGIKNVLQKPFIKESCPGCPG